MIKSQPGWLGPEFEFGPPKFESSVFPLRQLTRWRSFCFVEYHHVKDFAVGPGGLGVIIFATGSKIRRFDPGRGQWIFSERKNLEYEFLRKGSKAVGPVSYINGT